MIIYGWRASHIKSTPLDYQTCGNCGTKGSLLMSVYSKYVHIFWIPIFPFGKTGASVCQNCKQTLERNEMPMELKAEYNQLKAEHRAPLWQFVGLLLIGILAISVYFSVESDKKNTKTYLSTPLPGDLYKFETENGSYSTFKVSNVTNDSIFVFENQYEIARKSQVYTIDKPENYTKERYGYAKKEIQAMYNSGFIYEVERE